MLSCHDNFEATFDNYPSMLSYHQALSMASSWRRCKVKDLHVEPLDSASPLYGHPSVAKTLPMYSTPACPYTIRMRSC